MKIVQKLIESIRGASRYNPAAQAAPACILWTDKERQWEGVVTRLCEEMPELFILGAYDPGRRTGPAIWLRCVIGSAIKGISFEKEQPPILYLPGVSKQELRDVKSSLEYIKPLAELQYRGGLWSQVNGKDWTLMAFTVSAQGGLALDAAQDAGSRNAMQLAYSRFLDEELEPLVGRRLDDVYFNTLLTGGDTVRELLLWINAPDSYRASRSESEWVAFVEMCRSQFGFHPDKEGHIGAAGRLASRSAPWAPVWDRFCEAPGRYPDIPAHIRKTTPPEYTLFTAAQELAGWPQCNDEHENQLRRELAALADRPPKEAIEQIVTLAENHRARTTLVWAELGEADLARAVVELAVMAENTTCTLSAGSIEESARLYCEKGWQVDAAVLRALRAVSRDEDCAAVIAAVRVVYLPWIENAARQLQSAVSQSGYPGETIQIDSTPRYEDGECIVFVDGLRFDTAKLLAEKLASSGFQVDETPRWAALPSVTATGKPAVSPVGAHLSGLEGNEDFEPVVTASGRSLKGGQPLRALLVEKGWQCPDKSDPGNTTGKAWFEYGNIDHEGHNNGAALARQLPEVIEDIARRCERLVSAGWRKIRIVTDHGWLLMPGGLPRTELSAELAVSKWGRCAVGKPGAELRERQFPWYWNPDRYFVLADGISCFRSGYEYSHGGLSFQECLTLELTVGNTSAARVAAVVITDVLWRQMRCKVALGGSGEGLFLDIRTEPAAALSSVAMSIKSLGEDGAASVVVEDDDLHGTRAWIVILDSVGNEVARHETRIGGEKG